MIHLDSRGLRKNDRAANVPYAVDTTYSAYSGVGGFGLELMDLKKKTFVKLVKLIISNPLTHSEV